MFEGTLSECLLQAIHEIFTGNIEVQEEGEGIGQIVLSEGRIAWATCKGQSETLGIFMWRLGRITREQLSQVQLIFKENKGKKKFGAILEEMGVMSRPVLRRCLLLHTRSAIDSLLSSPHATAVMIQNEQRTDERILFGPEEVLPPDLSTDILTEWMAPDNTRARSWREHNPDNAILEPLFKLPGHLASAIISFDGGIISAYIEQDTLDMNVLAAFISAMLESSSRAVGATSLSTVDSIMLDCANGWLVARWFDKHRHNLLFVLIDEEGNPALTRHTINLMAPKLQRWLDEGGGTMDSPVRSSREVTSAPPPETNEAAAQEAAASEEQQTSSPTFRQWGSSSGDGGADGDNPGDMSEALGRLLKK